MLQRQWNRLDAALLTALQQEPGHFLNEQRYAARAFGHAVDDLLRQRVARGEFADHMPHLMAIEWGQEIVP